MRSMVKPVEYLWEDIPNLRYLGEKISPVDDHFKYLHAAQLIKHILGLKSKVGKRNFRLLYLFYDTPGTVSTWHYRELHNFKNAAEKDNIKFHFLTYQKLIIKLAQEFREKYPEYIGYITERYL